MLPKQWHHGHSIGAGLLVGIGLSRRPELVFAAGFLAAVLMIGFSVLVTRTVRWFTHRTDRTRNPGIPRMRGWEDYQHPKK